MKIFFKRLLSLVLFLIVAQGAAAQMEAMHMAQPLPPVANNAYLIMMDTMMVRMNQAPKGKTAEQEFLLQMIPHHQGALAMAQYEITQGKNFEMIQLAKSILAEQQSELTTIQFLLKQSEENSVIISSNFLKSMDQSMLSMMGKMPSADKLKDIDRAFAMVMLPHHTAAIDMAKCLLAQGKDQQILAFAKMLISNEQIEIQQMFTYIR